jgi:ankyrin repeat protein
MQRLLDGGAKTTADLQGAPMLVLAASSNCLAAIDVLIARGADVNAGDEDGTTALMHAAALGFVPIVQRLLDKGADLEKTNKDRQSAWLMAAMGNQMEVVEIFKAYRAAHPSPEPR